VRILENYQKGINLGGWISQYLEYSESHFRTFITEDDIRNISDMGFDHIRVPVDYEVIQNEDGSMIESGLQHIDNCITWAQKHSLHMILDLHKTKGYSFDEVESSSSFFTNVYYQSQFIELWRNLAIRYGNFENMLAFEILNEIVDTNVIDKWNELSKCCILKIREYAPTIKILLGGVDYNSVNSIKYLDDTTDENIVYNFHCYEPMIFTHQNAYWVKDMTPGFHTTYPKSLKEYKEEMSTVGVFSTSPLLNVDAKEIGTPFFEQLFKEAIEIATARNIPLYCGEFGVIDQAPAEDAVKWFKDITTIFKKYGIGSAIWNYKEKDFGIIDSHYATYRKELLETVLS